MTALREFLEAGLEGISKRLDMKKMFEQYSQGEDRTLVLRAISKRGREEEFGLYVNTNNWEIGVTESYAITDPTVRVTIDEDLMWILASRKQNLFSAYFQDLSIAVEGPFVLRDILILDKILELIHDCLLAEGIDLAAILAPT